MFFTYDLLALSLPQIAMIYSAARHHNHNQLRLTVWVEYNGEPEPLQGDNYFRNMQLMVKEVIHKNNNKSMATQLQYGITIRYVSDGYYHPTHQYGTSA